MMVARKSARRFAHVFSGDPALDRDHREFEKAWKTFLEDGDPKVLPCREGRRPTVYHCTTLQREHILSLGNITNPDALLVRHDAMVSFALAEVEAMVDEDGRPYVLTDKSFEEWLGGKRLKPEAMRELFNTVLILELGSRIWEKSHASPL